MANPNRQPIIGDVVSDYRLIPNLFNENRTAQITLGNKEQGEVKIFDLSGRLVGTYKITEGVNTIDVSVPLASSGLYIYKVFVDGDLKRTDKLVVVE